MRRLPRNARHAAEAATAYGEPTVKIADLKARLSAHLRIVRAGGSLTILDRSTPVARIVPMTETRDDLVIRPAIRTWSQVRLPPRVKLPPGFDSTALLRELRKDRF